MATVISAGYDMSGNNNDWTLNNINETSSTLTTYDIMNDVPTLTDEDTGNFATLNPNLTSGQVLTNANLTLDASTSAGSHKIGMSTIGVNSGKWYSEIYVDAEGYTYPSIGIGSIDHNYISNDWIGSLNHTYGYLRNGTIYNNNSLLSSVSTWTTGDTIGCALDLDNHKIYWYKNNTLVNTGGTSISTAYTYGFAVSGLATGSNTSPSILSVNFGQRPFKYTPPTGYKKLNTYNLPDSTIKDGSQYFDVDTWSGDSNATTQIPTPFSPDFVWIKNRSNTGGGGAASHMLYDTIRGVQKELQSNLTDAEGTLSTGLNSFDSDGYKPGTSTRTNATGNTYVGWSWRASDSSAVSNTDGTITSTVSANTDSGFSVVTYTSGATLPNTVGHGLSQAPEVVIYKVRNYSDEYWLFGWSGQPGYGLKLNTTDAKFATGGWSTMPTSTVFTHNVNASRDYVAYCFHSVEGFSKFGSYTGNGINGNGPFVYCGFRPAFILFKNTNTTQNWIIHDTARDSYNYARYWLSPNTSGAEYTDANIQVDLVSNGFKIRTSIGTELNGNGNTIIYMAFAENPFKVSLAR